MELSERFTIAGESKKVLVIVTHDGEALFKCKDMAKMLGYRSTKSAISRHVPEEIKYKYEDVRGQSIDTGQRIAPPYLIHE